MDDDCDAFVKDQQCLWNNPCYNTKKVKYLPLDIEILSDKKMRPKALCKSAKDSVLFHTQEDSKTVNKTVGDMCSMTTQDLCEFFMTSIQGTTGGVNHVFSTCQAEKNSRIMKLQIAPSTTQQDSTQLMERRMPAQLIVHSPPPKKGATRH